MEQRTSGDHKGRYRLVSGVGDGSTYCLDNRGDFSDSASMDIWSCVSDTDGAAVNQSVDLTASGNGWVLTFVKDSASSVLYAERSAGSQTGGVGQRADDTSARGDLADYRDATTRAHRGGCHGDRRRRRTLDLYHQPGPGRARQ